MNQISKLTFQDDHFSVRDILQLVKIHRKEIKLGFLTTLGDKTLMLLFSLAAESSHCILLTIKDIELGEQVGFLLGTLDTGAFYKDFFRKKFIKAVIVLLPKVFSFSTLRKLIEVLFYPSRRDIQEFPKAELLDIAISSKYQGKGLAKKLFKNFSAQLSDRAINEFKITTGEQLTGAQRFYESVGAVEKARIEVHKGKKTLVYLYKISV